MGIPVVPVAVVSVPPLPGEPHATPAEEAQRERMTAGQRKINLIWEYTQAVIAIAVVSSTMTAGLHSVFAHTGEQIPTVIGVAFGMVVGSYFQRTNHMNVGGVGPKPPQYQPYEGR